MRLRNLSIGRRDHGGNGNTDKWYAVTRGATLHIAVESAGGRGDLGNPEALPQEQADRGTEAMAQVVETYFH